MKHLYLALVLAGTAMWLTAAEPVSFDDPGFEKVNKKWYLRAIKNPKAPQAQLEYVTTSPHSGKYCLKVSDVQTNSGHYLSYYRAVPQNNGALKLTFRARSEEQHPFRAGLLFNSGTKPVKFLGGNIQRFTVTPQWQKFEVVCNVPKGSATMDLLICPTTQSYPETGHIYVDDVELIDFAADAPNAAKLGIDRHPLPRQDAPYAPADGATVLNNPPSFTFPAVHGWKPGKFTYTVEWSRNPAFPADATERDADNIYHIVIPRKVLAPGKWFWRYGVKADGKMFWSKARHFTVAPGTPELAWVDVNDLAKKVSREDLRSYITRDQLPAIRERAKNGDLKPLTDTMKRLLAKFKDAPLQEEPPYLSKDPKQRTLDFVRVMRGMTFHRMRAFALLYILTGDIQYGNEAKRQLLHFYGKWDPRGSTRITHNDEPGMHIHSHGLPAYDMVRELFTPEERKIVETSMHIRMNEFYDYLYTRSVDAHPYNSHAIYYFQLMGRLGLTLIHSYPEDAKRALDFSLRFFRTYLHPFAFPDGGWSEGPAYGSWGVERLCRYTHVVKQTTGLDLKKIHPFFKNCGYYSLYGWPGPSRQTSFGDGTSPAGQANMLRICAAINNNPVFLKPALDRKQPDDWMIWAAIIEKDTIGIPDMSKLPKAYHFPSIGFAALRTDMDDFNNDVGLLFQSNPLGAVSHHHNSHNCFMLEAFSEPLAISSGYYDYYSSPHHDKWTRQTKARNGITVDGGKGQMRGGHATGKLTKFINGSEFDIVEGDASPAYDMLKTAVRTIVHIRPGIFVIRDKAVSNKDKHVFEYNLHAFQPGEWDEKTQTVTLKMPKAECKVLFFGNAPWKFRSFDTFPIAPARTQTRPYPEQWHFVASAPDAAMELDLITVLLPYRTGEAAKLPRVEKLPDGVKVIYQDGHSATVRFTENDVITARD